MLAVIVAAVPNVVAALGVSILVGPAVVAALYNYLPGRALVSSVIDGLASAPVSAIARGTEAILTAAFLALGMLLGSRVGAGLGISYEPAQLDVPAPLSILGAAIGVLGIGLAWGTPRSSIVAVVAIATIGWLPIVLDGSNSTGPNLLAFGLASGLVGILGVVAATLQGSPSSIYVGVAILPLVPGFTLNSSMLALAQGETADATAALADAGVISLAIAVGVAVGLSIGKNTIKIGKQLSR